MARTWSRLYPKHGADMSVADVTAASNIALSNVWVTREGLIWCWDQAEYHPDSRGPETFARIAMSPDGRTLWAVDSDGSLWSKRPGRWTPIATVGLLSAPIDDISVDFTGSCWLTGTDGTVWMTSGDGKSFDEFSALIPIRRIATAHDGRQWGIVASASGALWTRASHREPWFATRGSDFGDLSVSPDGDVWLITLNGSAVVTTDGESFTTLSHGPFHAVQAMKHGEAYLAGDAGEIWYTEPGFNDLRRVKFVNLVKFEGNLRRTGLDAQFVPGQSSQAVLERIPIGNGRIALRDQHGDWVTVQPDGSVTIDGGPGPGGGRQVFIEVMHDDGTVSLLLPRHGDPALPLGSWRGVPGSPDVYPRVVLMSSEEIGDGQKFRYGLPDVELLPLGRNESIPENSGAPSDL